MSQLQENLYAILEEKNNIKAENIRQGITIFDIEGSYEAGNNTMDATAENKDIRIGQTAYSQGQKLTGTLAYDMYKFNSIDEMNRFTLAQNKDYGLVYNTNAEGIQNNTTYSNLIFPNTVILTDFQYTNVPEEVLVKAKELAYGYDNFIVLQNSETKEYYIPYQTSIYNENTFKTTAWRLNWYKDAWHYVSPCYWLVGLMKYIEYSHTFESVAFAKVDTNSNVLYDWGDYKLEPVYASKNITILNPYNEWETGDIFYPTSKTLTNIGSYPNTLPYIYIDINKAEFYLNGFTEKVIYTSVDGIVYNRVDKQNTSLNCSIVFDSTNYFDVLPYFMKSGESAYDLIGIYQYYNNQWNKVPTNITASKEHILAGKQAYTIDGVQEGTMLNNGSLDIIPRDIVVEIPEGYTSGGIVQAIDITSLSDYEICNELSAQILGELPVDEDTYTLVLDVTNSNITIEDTTLVIEEDINE